MPTYKITAPDGKKLKITGEKPPTEQELNEIFAKISDNNSLSAPEISAVDTEKKGIDLTPSGLAKQNMIKNKALIEAPLRAIKNNQGLDDAYNSIIDEENQKLSASNPTPVADFITDITAYGGLPILSGTSKLGNIAAFGGNAAIQGGVPGMLEGLKAGDNPFISAGKGTAIAGGLNALLSRIPVFGNVLKKGIENPEFQISVAKSLEGLTSVPQKYSERAIEAELAGNSILGGNFNKDNAYRPIEAKLRTAKSLLPTSESYADEFYNLGQKAKIGIENLKESAGQEISDMLGNLKATPVNIYGLKNSLNSLIKSYAKGGNINPAEIRAGRDLELVKDLLGMKNEGQVNKELSNYFNANRIGAGIENNALDKEAQEIAFNILSQATKKDKRWLKSQLNANMPKMSTQKRQEFIQELLDSADDRIENIDPAWRNYFPELTLENTQGGKGDIIARQMFDRIMGKNFKNAENIVSPMEDAIDEASIKYNNLLYDITKNPDKQNINKSYNKFNEIIKNLDDETKELFTQQYANDLDNIQNTINPLLKPIDLHNAKEILYDMANYDTAGGTRNEVLKSMANQINNFLRTKFPQYKAPNDKFAKIKKLEYNLGGANGINSNTIGGKLSNYGSAANIESGLDRRLRDINNILPQQDRFINDTKNLVNSQNEVNNINKLINSSYERNPRLLSNINDTAREEALENLQKMTGVNFMDELNDVRAREALEALTPGQGGGYGSEQGFYNRVRGDILESFGGRGIPGVSTAAAATLFSPRLMAQGNIKNLGRLYRSLGQKVPEGVQRLINPLVIKASSPTLYGRISND